VAGFKGGYFGTLVVYPSELAQTFWTAVAAWTTCFGVTIVVSLLTRPRPAEELRGLVYSLTPRPPAEPLPLLARPASLAVIVLGVTLLLNVVFF
jgi:solute:Na+ symporter, SSS family